MINHVNFNSSFVGNWNSLAELFIADLQLNIFQWRPQEICLKIFHFSFRFCDEACEHFQHFSLRFKTFKLNFRTSKKSELTQTEKFSAANWKTFFSSASQYLLNYFLFSSCHIFFSFIENSLKRKLISHFRFFCEFADSRWRKCL